MVVMMCTVIQIADIAETDRVGEKAMDDAKKKLVKTFVSLC